MLVEANQNELGLRFASNGRFQLTPVSGSWQDYIDGKTIELKATEEGEKSFLEFYTQSIKTAFNTVREVFKGTPPGEMFGFSEPHFSQLEFSALSDSGSYCIYVKASVNALEIQTSQIKYVLQLGMGDTSLESEVDSSHFDHSFQEGDSIDEIARSMEDYYSSQKTVN